MITSPTETYLPYEQIRAYATGLSMPDAAVPDEHSVSLPLPTRRLTVPGYAVFAGPAVRSPSQPLRLGLPDRWWAVRAQRRELLCYALSVAFPFASTTLTGPVTVSAEGRSIASLQEDLKVLAELFDRAAPVFFTGGQGDDALRTDIRETLSAVLPRDTIPWYQQLVPDLFAWLDGAGSA